MKKMSNELATSTTPDAKMMEKVLLQGDLKELNPAQRVTYYMEVCRNLGINPMTRPFDYITLNGRLTLYARKDAADQLRKVHNVSIDDVDIHETDTHFVVKVKGHDQTGRSDVELGVVGKNDMNNNIANAQMKAVTKAKRRLTLSLCGLGFLDETEVETIPDAVPVTVLESGEIETPIQKGIRLYKELCVRADAVKVKHALLPDSVTINQARDAYKELLECVENAERQAAA